MQCHGKIFGEPVTSDNLEGRTVLAVPILFFFSSNEFLKFKFYFFIFGCAGSSLLHMAFFSCGEWGLLSSMWASHCGGFSCCRAWALGTWASVVVTCGPNSCGSRALEHGLSSCGPQA